MPAHETLADTLPADWYHDAEQFERERRMVFARNWWLVGRADEVARPGDYITADVAGWPVFAVRDREGGLRAFHNVCRHRAGPLFTDRSGHCQALRCRYHGWIYGFDGALRTAPGFPETGALDKSKFGLFPVRIETWRGLVFVCLDAGAPALLSWMGDIDRLADDFPAAHTLPFFDETTVDGACDWKAYGDNSCEGYHLPFVHASLDKAVSGCVIRAYENGGFVGFDVDYGGASDVRANKGLWIYKFPGLLLHYSDRALNIEQVEPRGPGAIRLRSWYWFPKGEEAYGRDYMADSIAIMGEDMGLCERVQKNLAAGLYRTGKLSPVKEPGTIFFQHLIRTALDAEPPSLGIAA